MEKKSKESLIHHLSEAIECFENLSKASARAAAGLEQLGWAVQEDDWKEFETHFKWVAENMMEVKKLYDKMQSHALATGVSVKRWRSVQKGGSNEESYS